MPPVAALQAHKLLNTARDCLISSSKWIECKWLLGISLVLSCFVKVVAASSVGALAVACLELLRAQAHLTMNASFEFETFRQDELFWMNTFLGGGNGFDSVFFGFVMFSGTIPWYFLKLRMRLIKHIPMLTKIIVLEVQAAVVACSALLPLAAEAWGVLRIRTTHQNPKSVNKRQSELRNGVGMLT